MSRQERGLFAPQRNYSGTEQDYFALVEGLIAPGASFPARRQVQRQRQRRWRRGMSEATNSMRRLRRILRLAIVLRRLRRLSAGAADAHFLHALPLLRRNHHDVLRLEHVVGHATADEHVITRLDIGHSNTVAAFAQRRIFVEFDGLRYVVRTEDGQLWRVHGFDFSYD